MKRSHSAATNIPSADANSSDGASPCEQGKAVGNNNVDSVFVESDITLGISVSKESTPRKAAVKIALLITSVTLSVLRCKTIMSGGSNSSRQGGKQHLQPINACLQSLLNCTDGPKIPLRVSSICILYAQ
mmetsp:Transcript_37500/g.60758  ORF Transcript_37500/g.60758 Transcript_37500/m.60758 type:complete len:130 (+) Transcript_37500:654-1043(+)